MAESKGLDLTISNLPEKYKERILERRRTHGTRRTTFRNFNIILPPRPAEQPSTPEQILQSPECPKSPNNDDLKQVTSRSRSSQMSMGSPMEIDYSINVGNIEVLISKSNFSDYDDESSKFINEEDTPLAEVINSLEDIIMNEIPASSEEQSDIIMDEVDILATPEKQLDIIMNEEEDTPVKSPEIQRERVTEEINQGIRRSSRRNNKIGDVEIPAKSPEIQREQVTKERKISRKSSKHPIDIVMDEEEEQVTEDIIMNEEEDSPAKSPEIQRERVTEEINKGIRRSSRRNNKIGDVQDEIPAKSPEIQRERVTKERKTSRKSTKHPKIGRGKLPEDQFDIVMDEEEAPEEEQVAEEIINQGRRRSSRRKNKIGDVVQNGIPARSPEEQVTKERKTSRKSSKHPKIGRGRIPAKSTEDQFEIVMDEEASEEAPEEEQEQVTEKIINQGGRRSSRRKNKIGDVVREGIDERGQVTRERKTSRNSPKNPKIGRGRIPAKSTEDQFDIVMDEETSEEEQVAEINQGASRRKIKCHKIGQDKDGKKIRAVKLNELDVVGSAINDTITEFMNNNPFKKEVQHFKKEIELQLLEQSDLIDEQIMLRSSLRQSKSRINCLRRELLEVQRERDRVCKELANERRTFAKEEQDRKKLEQAHNFLTDLETLREAVDAEEVQEDEEILDGFEGLLVSATSHSLEKVTNFNTLLEICEVIIRSA